MLSPCRNRKIFRSKEYCTDDSLLTKLFHHFLPLLSTLLPQWILPSERDLCHPVVPRLQLIHLRATGSKNRMQIISPSCSLGQQLHTYSWPSLSHHDEQSMIAQDHFTAGSWIDMTGSAYLSALPRNLQQDPRFHKRASSSSSIVSAGPPSPLNQNFYHPRIVPVDHNYAATTFDYDYHPKTAYSLPEQMMLHNAPSFAGIDMRRIHSASNDGQQSASTMSQHNSPATPQAWDGEYDDRSTAYQQSLQDVFPDQMVQYTTTKMNNHRHNMQERIQEAQNQHLRTKSPTSNPRTRSPFKSGSTEMASSQLAVPEARAPSLVKQRTSVSPKELMLDENDIDYNQPALFAERPPATLRQQSSMSNFYNMPSLNQEPSIQIPQNYPFASQPSSQNVQADSEPAFKPPMLSMESTNEEGPSPSSSQQSMRKPQARLPARPANVTSDAGTYSCTYHGCPQRFESPAKLQKHKREGHRQHETTTTSSVVSTAIAARNSQAGPHRCDRLNPSTGKPCNSVFSRPYDLTRHEDTIHNNRKQKVRCHLCVEEKTFSRNDALTRHMRVVHPDVDWAGKQRKRSTR